MAKPIDIATHTRALTADGSDNLVVTNQLQVSTIDTSDSSAITITPAAVFSSDVSIENELRVTNAIENSAGQTILPATLGTANYVLTVNSAGTAVEWAEASGGGVARTEEFPTVTNGSPNVTMGAAYTLDQLDVYLNGARLRSTVDYTVSSTTLTFTENLTTGDIVAIYAYDTASNLITGNWSDLNDVSVVGATTNAMVRYNGSNWVVGQTTEDASGNVTVVGTVTGGGLTVDTNTLHVDAANNRVGIGNTSPATALDVTGDITASGSLFVPIIDTADSSALTVTPATVFSSDVTVENDLVVTNKVTATDVTASGTVSGATVTSTGDVNDSVGDVRAPRLTQIDGGDTTESNEGVYNIGNSATLTTFTIGSPSAGTIMVIYNNKSSSITLARGSTVSNMRKGADNDTTNNATLTLGARSLTTITVTNAAICIVTGTDVT